MNNWQQYVSARSELSFYLNETRGFHGIASVRKNICDIVQESPDKLVSKNYNRTAHSVLVSIDFRHFLLRRRVDTYIFHDAIAYKYLPKWKQIILRYVQERLLRRAKTVVCISYYAQTELRKYHPQHFQKSIVIYNEIDLEKERQYVLWVGNSKAHKGLEEALKCSEALGCKLLLVGIREVSPKYQNCVCLINLPTEAYLAIIKNASALLVTSYDEGFHLPTAEALALNTSVFALDIPPLREIYGDKISLHETVEDLKFSLDQHVANCK